MLHFVTLVFLVRISDAHTERDESTKPDGEFKPNVKNSVVFLYSMVLTASTFMINYEGEPFMQPLKENTKLYKTLGFMWVVAAVAIFDASDLVREWLQLVPFPTEEFQFQVAGALIVDTALCFAVERTTKFLYRRFRERKQG